MLLIPYDVNEVLTCLILTFSFEFLRILIAYICARPSDEIRNLQAKRIVLTRQIAEIKSVQLQFVEHSKLGRDLIKVEKALENLNFEYKSRAPKVKKLARIIRMITYIVVALFFYNKNIIMIQTLMIWPIPIFTNMTNMNTLIFLPIAGLAWRQFLRSILPIICNDDSFP